MREKIGYMFLATLCGFFLFFNSLLMLIMPPLLMVEIVFIFLEYFCIKRIKKINLANKEKKNFENELLRQGYKKVCNDLFINEKEHKLNINGKDYGFGNIKDCELKTNDNVDTYILNNMAMSQKYCTSLYINIVVDDFENPNVKLNFIKGRVSCSSGKYTQLCDGANYAMSSLKLIISKNQERYVESGTVTKVEHRYVTEENVSLQIERLSQLYKDGALSEYEFEMKKKELLDKVK